MAGIIGTDANDVLFGSWEDDYLDGGRGEDALNGGPGNDTYVLRNLGSEIIEYPREGLYDKAIVYFSYALPNDVENVDLQEGIFAYGNRSDNLVEGNRERNILMGFGRNDVIYGFERKDVINGGRGNDRLFGGGGNDILIGGKGYDELFGGEGNDIYYVDSYAFRIEERRGRSNDTLRIPLNYELGKTEVENLTLLGNAKYGTGNLRDNTVSGNKAGNVLSGLEGNDTLLGQKGNDTLYGNQDKDQLYGGDGADQLYGQEGNDQLFGDRGNDQLIGESGRDILTGYGGDKRERDRLIGGESADLFVLGAAGSTHYLGSGFATIADFEREDQIQISDRLKTYKIVTSRNFSGSAERDTAIFQGKDLIAIVQDTIDIGIRSWVVASI